MSHAENLAVGAQTYINGLFEEPDMEVKNSISVESNQLSQEVLLRAALTLFQMQHRGREEAL